MTHENDTVWLNGRMIPWREATVPILSHGFSRGSAFFDLFGVHVGPDGPVAFRMDEHLKRFEKSAELLEMRLPCSTGEIIAAVKEVVAANRLGRGIVKLVAYWGEEAVISLVLDSPLDLAIFPIADSPELALDQATPITACLSRWRKLHPDTVPGAAKACANYLNGYLARRDARNRGFDIGIMLDTGGHLAEGSTEALFIVEDGTLKVPPLGRVLSSITRLSVIEAAPSIGLAVAEEIITEEQLRTADEIFCVHTGIKVHPVRRFEDRNFEAPGPVTRRMMTLMDDIISFRNDRFKHWFQPLT
jgi:branched-chain amino acid aminotransferase